MTIRNRIRRRLREWLLTDDEREIVSEVQRLDGDVSDMKGDVDAFVAALDSADIYGEDGLELDEADILVVAGHNNLVQDAEFGEGIYIGGQNQVVRNTLHGAGDD